MSDSENTRIAMPPASDSLPPGTQLNGIYEIDRKIASGGMGEVYRGHNIHTDEPVAIKAVLPELARDETILGLFTKEARVLSRLSHDAIIRYHAFAVDPVLRRPYLAMEFVDGISLADLALESPLAGEDVRRLLIRLASGLYVAHSAGVIHRDLSPDNVILPNRRVEEAKLIDFGIAKSTQLGEKTLLGDKFAGKYNFVSPEQLGLFGGKVTAQSDVYSLGLVAASALLGRAIDMSGSLVESIERRRVVPDLGGIVGPMRQVIEAMLVPEPEQRLADMEEVVYRLYDIQPGDLPGGPNTRSARSGYIRSLATGSLQPRSLPPTPRDGAEAVEAVVPVVALDQTEPETDLGAGPGPGGDRDHRAAIGADPDISRDADAVLGQDSADPAPSRETSWGTVASDKPDERAPDQRGSSIPPTPAMTAAPPRETGSTVFAEGTTIAPSAETFAPAASPVPEATRFGPTEPPSSKAAASIDAWGSPVDRQEPDRFVSETEAPREAAFVARDPVGAAGDGEHEAAIGSDAIPPSESPFGPYEPGDADLPDERPHLAPTPRGPRLLPILLVLLLFLGGGGAALWYGGLIDGGPASNEATRRDTATSTEGRPSSAQAPDEAAPSKPAPAAGPSPAIAPAPTTAPNPTEAPSVPNSAPIDATSERVAWIAAFDGGDCFLAIPSSLTQDHAQITGYGREAAPFQRMLSEFKQRFGVEPDIGVRLIQGPQCPVLTFVKALASRNAPRPSFSLSDDLISAQDALKGTLSQLGNRNLWLYLTGNDGVVYNLGKLVNRQGETANFNIRLGLQSDKPRPQVMIALTSDKPLPEADISDYVLAENFYPALLRAIEAGKASASTSIEYFRLQQ